MNDLGVHIGLLALMSLAIVTLGAFFNHQGDEEALKDLPKRYVVFLVGCAVVAVVMLVIENTGASLG